MLQLLARKGTSAQPVDIETASDWANLGYTISVFLEHTLDESELDEIKNGGAISISEVTIFSSTGANTNVTQDTTTIINNAAAARQFPELALSALQLVAAAMASNSSAALNISASDADAEVNRLLNETSQEQSTSHLSGSPSAVSMESLGVTKIVSIEPFVVQRIVPFEEAFNALNQQ